MMGMTIDKSKQLLSHYQRLFNNLNGDYRLSQVQASELSHSIDTALDIMRRYQMMELDRKADMVTMLEEISLEFDEQYYVNRHELHDDLLNRGLEQGQSIIQQKIDKLRGEQA